MRGEGVREGGERARGVRESKGGKSERGERRGAREGDKRW